MSWGYKYLIEFNSVLFGFAGALVFGFVLIPVTYTTFYTVCDFVNYFSKTLKAVCPNARSEKWRSVTLEIWTMSYKLAQRE